VPVTILEQAEVEAERATNEGEAMKAAIYCRVSTEAQEREGTSLDSQLEACLTKAKQLGYEVPKDHVFSEAFSGLTLSRPQLERLRNMARVGAIEAVIVYKPDRLARVGEDILVLAKEFKADGVKLVLVLEQWDDTLNGKLVAFMLGWASEFYVATTVEATTRAKRKLVQEGILPQGTGKGLYGYKWDKQQKKRIPLEFEAQIVNKIFTMLGDGISCFNVAKTLNDHSIPTKSGKQWEPRTIRRMAKNAAYIGLTYFGMTTGSNKTTRTQQPRDGWTLLPDATPAIISKELFERVQKIRQQARELHLGRPLQDYLLKSHTSCGYCGSPLVGSFLNRKYRYYHCRGYYPTASRGRICNAGYIKANLLEEVVWEKITEVLEKPEVILAELQRQVEVQGKPDGTIALEKEIKKLRRQITNYETQEKRLIKLFRYGEINKDSILDELNRLKEDRQADEEQLTRYSYTKEQLARLANTEIKLNEFCERVHQNLGNCTIEDKRLALDALDIKVIATPDRIDIQGVIPIDVTAIQSSEEFITTGQTSA
jgi:site-specific DNA recombinase